MKEEKKKGKLVVIIGPSASGKTHMVQELLSHFPNSVRHITSTTRAPREGEMEGRDYHFLSRAEFEAGIERGDFFEYAEVHGHLYGSSREHLDRALAEHEIVFAIIDVKGALVLKNLLDEVFTIFIRPGSVAEIRERLLAIRGSMIEGELEERLKSMEYEMAQAEQFDLIIDNPPGRFDNALHLTSEAVSCYCRRVT